MSLRVNCYFGPSSRYDGAAFFMYHTLNCIPGVQAYWYQCKGDPRLFAKADLHLAIDWAEDIWPDTASFQEPRPLVYWMADTHCSPASKRFRYDKAKRADHVYCSFWFDVEPLEKEGVKAKWLPFAVEPSVFAAWQAPLKYDVGFVGHVGDYSDRMEFLDSFFKEFPSFNFEWNVYMELCALEMRKAKVGINHCWMPDSINMRTVETMSAGICLLNPASRDLPWLGMEDGVHLLSYKNFDEAVDKTRRVLADDALRLQIAEAGRALVLQHHTYASRALTILREVTGDPWKVDIGEVHQAMKRMSESGGRAQGGKYPQALPVIA